MQNKPFVFLKYFKTFIESVRQTSFSRSQINKLQPLCLSIMINVEPVWFKLIQFRSVCSIHQVRCGVITLSRPALNTILTICGVLPPRPGLPGLLRGHVQWAPHWMAAHVWTVQNQATDGAMKGLHDWRWRPHKCLLRQPTPSIPLPQKPR